MNENTKQIFSLYVRNIIFGVEDSLVSTVGLLSGIAFSGMARGHILLAGLVLISVEAFSMAVGSFLSEQSTREYMSSETVSVRHPLLGGVVMFASYFVSGFIPLMPYILFDPSSAFLLSISLSMIALFILGAWSAKFFKRSMLKLGFRMFLIGGVAIALGVMVGKLVNGK